MQVESADAVGMVSQKRVASITGFEAPALPCPGAHMRSKRDRVSGMTGCGVAAPMTARAATAAVSPATAVSASSSTAPCHSVRRNANADGRRQNHKEYEAPAHGPVPSTPAKPSARNAIRGVEELYAPAGAFQEMPAFLRIRHASSRTLQGSQAGGTEKQVPPAFSASSLYPGELDSPRSWRGRYAREWTG